MKIAFDFDGVISRHPKRMIALARSLAQAGVDVFILTAAAGELPPEKRPEEVRRRVDAIGGHGLRIVCVESAEKPDYCDTHGVDFLIDDTKFSMRGTVLLHVA